MCIRISQRLRYILASYIDFNFNMLRGIDGRFTRAKCSTAGIRYD